MEESLALDQQNKRDLENQKRPTKLSAAKQQVQQKAKKQVEQVVKKAVKKSILRIVNVSCAATIVGIIITYFIMTFQVIAGNLMGYEEIKLEPWEVLVWAFLSVIVFFVIMLILVMITLAASPWEMIKIGTQMIIDFIFGD